MRPAGPPLVGDRATDLVPWVAAGVLGAAELHGAEVLLRAELRPRGPLQLATALALWAPLHGHVCFDLARADELVLGALSGDESSDEGPPTLLPWPPIEEWIAALRSSELVREVGGRDDAPVLDGRPLVLSGTRLYVQRQWVDECIVAAELARRAGVPAAALGPTGLGVLDALWPATGDGADDAQRNAARAATSASWTAIVGGPGSGKTYTVTGILAALVADATGAPPVIGLAAPTGKAAQRMRDSIAAAVDRGRANGSLDARVAGALAALEPTTLHRLLGPLPAVRTRFRHDRTNPLPHDVVVVDETSMVALPMMSRLLEALRPDARLVLIGDPDQLESVEAGAVLTDVVAAAAEGSSIAARVVRLGRSRRHGSDSPIGPLADAIRDGRHGEALALLDSSPAGGAIELVETADPLAAASTAAVRAVVGPAAVAARGAAHDGRAAAALDAVASVRVLCAHRRGPFGADRWNELIESWVIDGAAGRRNFAGRPLLASRNDLRTGVSNGDSGVMVTSSDGLVAAFAIGGEIRLFAPAQLDSVETAYATTVHKSQGSEHDTVVVILPPATSPLARRELLYTAVTRAKNRVVLVGSRGSLAAAISTSTVRSTGLIGSLRAGGG